MTKRYKYQWFESAKNRVEKFRGAGRQSGKSTYYVRDRSEAGIYEKFSTLPEAEAFREKHIKEKGKRLADQRKKEQLELQQYAKWRMDNNEPYHPDGCKRLVAEVCTVFIEQVERMERDACLELVHKNKQIRYYLEALGSDIETLIYDKWKYWLPVLIRSNRRMKGYGNGNG
jgi:hypothetical protein